MDQCNHCQQELIGIDNRGERPNAEDVNFG